MIWIPIILVSGALIYLPYILNENNADYLLSGYNSMSEEKRKNFDLKGYLKFLKTTFPAIGGVVLIQFVPFYFLDRSHYGMVVMVFIICLALPIIIIKSQRFDHNLKSRNRIVIFVVCGILALIPFAMSYSIYTTTQPTIAAVKDRSLIFSGSYGEEIPLQSIVDVSIESQLPRIRGKRNGFAMGGYRKGKFRSTEGNVTLYQAPENRCFLRVSTDKNLYYWGSDEAQVRKAFEQVKLSH